MELHTLADAVVAISEDAADAILAVYNDPAEFEVDTKADDSPVTKADIAANTVIVKALRELTPDIPILTEESSMAPFSERQHWPRYWIVDPLDGTKEFIRRNDQFTVNIALVENHQAVLGVVLVPVSGVAYVGVKGHGAQKREKSQVQSIQCRALNPSTINVVASAHHSNAETEAFISAVQNIYGETTRKSIGSSLKFCLLAEGLADVYPRFAPTSEWDTAAAHAVLEAAGGEVYREDGSPMRYNTKENILNPYFFAVADTSVDWNSVVQQAKR